MYLSGKMPIEGFYKGEAKLSRWFAKPPVYKIQVEQSHLLMQA